MATAFHPIQSKFHRLERVFKRLLLLSINEYMEPEGPNRAR
jgi:hypothetical protein